MTSNAGRFDYCSPTRLGTKNIWIPLPSAGEQSLRTNNSQLSKMSACVACNKPLEVEVEADEEEEYEVEASSSGKAPAVAPETVPDDVQLSCGCHFHW